MPSGRLSDPRRTPGTPGATPPGWEARTGACRRAGDRRCLLRLEGCHECRIGRSVRDASNVQHAAGDRRESLDDGGVVREHGHRASLPDAVSRARPESRDCRRSTRRSAMDAFTLIDRRTLLADLGRGAFALAVVSVAGCAPAAQSSASQSAAASGRGSDAAKRTADRLAQRAAERPTVGRRGVAWERVNLGFVSAYILSRGGEAAIVDTGVGGSADAIEQSLTAVGLDWSAVGHLILTHKHGDHAGSAADVLERARRRDGLRRTPRTSRRSRSRVRSRRWRTATMSSASRSSRLPATPRAASPSSIRSAASSSSGDAMGTDGGRPTLPGHPVHRGHGPGQAVDREARCADLRDPAGRPWRPARGRRVGGGRGARRGRVTVRSYSGSTL